MTGQVVDVPVNFDLQRRNKVRDKIEQHTIAKLPSSPDSCFGTYLDCMNLTHRYFKVITILQFKQFTIFTRAGYDKGYAYFLIEFDSKMQQLLLTV